MEITPSDFTVMIVDDVDANVLLLKLLLTKDSDKTILKGVVREETMGELSPTQLEIVENNNQPTSKTITITTNNRCLLKFNKPSMIEVAGSCNLN